MKKQRTANTGFCNIGAEAIPISIGSLLGFGSGRSLPSFSGVFQFSFLFLSSSSVFQLGSLVIKDERQKIFKFAISL
jgi:hypothetical protein